MYVLASETMFMISENWVFQWKEYLYSNKKFFEEKFYQRSSNSFTY